MAPVFIDTDVQLNVFPYTPSRSVNFYLGDYMFLNKFVPDGPYGLTSKPCSCSLLL